MSQSHLLEQTDLGCQVHLTILHEPAPRILSTAPVEPPLQLWQHAIALGKPDLAAMYRTALTATEDDPTWQDAEWQ